MKVEKRSHCSRRPTAERNSEKSIHESAPSSARLSLGFQSDWKKSRNVLCS